MRLGAKGFIVIGLAAMALAACADGNNGDDNSGASDSSVTVGAVYLDTQGFYSGVRKGVEDGAEEAGTGITINDTNAQGDAGKESSFVNTLVSSEVDALLISAVSEQGSIQSVRAADEAGVPVICYNTCVTEEEMQEHVYAYAVGDPVEFGFVLGEAAADYFQSEGIESPKIAVIGCESIEVCVQRRAGFEDALQEANVDYELVANQEGTVLDEAITAGENILTANSTVDAFFGESGGATEGAIKAVENRDAVGETVVFGSDMTTAIAGALADNSVLKSVVDVSGQTMGRVAIALALDASEGVERDEIIEPVEIDIYTKASDGTEWLEVHPDGIP